MSELLLCGRQYNRMHLSAGQPDGIESYPRARETHDMSELRTGSDTGGTSKLIGLVSPFGHLSLFDLFVPVSLGDLCVFPCSIRENQLRVAVRCHNISRLEYESFWIAVVLTDHILKSAEAEDLPFIV